MNSSDRGPSKDFSSDLRSELPTKPVVFFREGFFYTIMVYEDEDVSEHAMLNPGTLRIEDLEGNVLWRPQ